MEAVVDMTPQLRISSSAGQRQRSLSPSPALLLPPFSTSHSPPPPPLTDPHVRVLTSANDRFFFTLPHYAAVEPATGAGREEALGHGVPELGRGGQTGTQGGASPFCISEARQARGVLQVEHKHSTCRGKRRGGRDEKKEPNI